MIPAGIYDVTLETSGRFGADTITINGVPGYKYIRVHGGNAATDTDGCVIVGDKQDREQMRISGAQADHVLARLKAKIKAALDAGDPVRIQIRNASEWYERYGLPYPGVA